MIYYFIYETTNIVNLKRYRGIHKTSKIDDGYLGSGTALLNAIEKYGKQNFKREILEFCSSYEELLEREKFYVDEEWVKDYSNYNLKTGGQSAGILSEESRNKISETLKSKYESGEIVKIGIKGLTPWCKGLKMSKEFCDKISQSLRGRVPWNKGVKGYQVPWNKGLKTGPQSEELKKKKSETLKKRYSEKEHHSKGVEPWNKGKKGIQEAWNKGKVMEKIECPHCGKFCDKLNAKKWHFDRCKSLKNKD